jgi:putative DNA primase/helicase
MPPEQLMPADAQPEHRGNLPVLYEQIPRELLEYPQWVCWRYVERGPNRKPDKQPVNPWTLHNAGVHWANTWSTCQHVYMTYLMYAKRGINGIGFVVTKDDPFVGVDIDNCFADNRFTLEAQEIVQHLGSYTEVSPSGRGLRILIACADYLENRRTRALEIYSHSRFLTLTGNRVEGAPATITQVMKEQITALTTDPATELKAQAVQPREPIPCRFDGMQLWTHIFEHDQYGAQHLKRFLGDTSFDRGDHSFAVIRLLNSLARWTKGDAVKMRSMMLLSPLVNEKWFSKRGTGDWLDHQIADAIRYVR